MVASNHERKEKTIHSHPHRTCISHCTATALCPFLFFSSERCTSKDTFYPRMQSSLRLSYHYLWVNWSQPSNLFPSALSLLLILHFLLLPSNQWRWNNVSKIPLALLHFWNMLSPDGCISAWDLLLPRCHPNSWRLSPFHSVSLGQMAIHCGIHLL